jgi:hypothetical protein
MLCIYAVVPGGAVITSRGAGRELLRTIAEGPVAAVVGRRATRPDGSRQDLVAYDAAVRRIATQSAATLPARFNTLAADDDEVRGILRDRAALLRRSLGRVRGRSQMTIRVTGLRHAESGTRPAPRERRERDAGAGAAFLRARAATRQIRELDPVRSAVARWVRDERVERRGTIGTLHHLVPNGSIDRYRAAVLMAPIGCAFVVSGPFPPYAFAESW